MQPINVRGSIIEIMKKNLEFPFIGSAPGVEFAHSSEEYRNTTINCRRSKNINDILDFLFQHVEGDVLEIGALSGTSTRVLCEISKKYNRTVHVVDPWDGREAGDDYMYRCFLEKTSRYDNVKVLRASSVSNEAISYIKNLDLAFCLVDGLHTYDYALSDLRNVVGSMRNSGVICLDDINLPDVKNAASTFEVIHNDWHLLEIEGQIESFFIKD